MKTFTLRETNIAKGVACILLLVHHLFYNSERFDMFYHIFGIDNPPVIYVLAKLSKVCVAIFVILSGYGLTKSFKKGEQSKGWFTYKHFVKLFCQYWFIFIIFVPLGFVLGKNPIEIYGGGYKGLIKCLIDFCGLANLCGTPTMNVTWWYMGAVIILYAIFPFLFRQVEKQPIVMLLIAAIISIFGTVTGMLYHAIVAWILPFVMGIFLAHTEMLDKIVNTKHKYFVPFISFAMIIAFAVIRLLMRDPIKMDTFFGLSIIIFTVSFLSRLKYVDVALQFIGIHSANIFMMHTFIYYYYFKRLIYAAYYPILILLVLLISSLIVSMGLERLKILVRYDRLSTILLYVGERVFK